MAIGLHGEIAAASCFGADARVQYSSVSYLLANQSWLLRETNDLNSVVVLPAIGCELKLSDIYARIEFKPS